MLEELFGLKGKTAIVTGGAGYLGTAISEVLAKAGANVIIASRNVMKCEKLAKELNEKFDVSAKAIQLDLHQNNFEDFFEKIVNESKTIDILVNNAYFGAGNLIENMTEQEWKLGIDGTINQVFKCTKAVLPIMKIQKKGSIINISSMYGVVSPNPEIYENNHYNSPANYGAGKAAIIQFTRYIASYYGKYGIRANTISPGPFPNLDVQKNTEFINQLAKKNPLGRIGQPKDLQGIMLLLASDASNYITGQNICVDGGWTIW